MAQIAPFRALRFNLDKVSSIARVVAPPYDVIEPAQEKDLCERDEHNVVRLTMGKPPAEGRPEADYGRAAELLAAWRREGVLVQDEEPCVYIVEQAFSVGGEEFVRLGFIAALLLEEFGEGDVHPHELTMEGPKADRLRLMEACSAKLSPVLTTCSDPDGAVDALVADLRTGDPLYTFSDDENVAYRVWRVADRAATDKLVELIRHRALFIADGHHRYETSLNYRRRHRSGSGPPGSAPEDFIPTLCVSVVNSGLKILPTHRCVSVDSEPSESDIRSALERHFRVSAAEAIGGVDRLLEAFDAARHGADCVGCYLPGGRLFLLEPGDIEDLRPRFPESADAWWRLPVGLLHYVVLPDLLGFAPGSPDESQRVTYSHEAADIYHSVEAGGTIGFLLPATDAATVAQVAAQGQRLPQKSTYFYPKVVSGLALYPHD